MRTSAIASAVLLSGCVTTGRYRKLQEDYQALVDQTLLADREAEVLRVEVSELQQEVEELGESLADEAIPVELIEAFGPLLEEGTMRLVVYPDRMALAFDADTSFETGQARLSEEGRERITQLADRIRRFPRYEFEVQGHTDPRTIATRRFSSNWELGAARAAAAVEALVAAGVPPGQLSVASFGSTDPIASNETLEGMKQNRRIQVVVALSLDDVPGHEALQEWVHEPRITSAQPSW